MIKEFEGRSEKEAVAKAAAELGSDRFDVEVVDDGGGIFRRGKVKIRVHADEEFVEVDVPHEYDAKETSEEVPEVPEIPAPEEVKTNVCEYVTGIIEHMGYAAEVSYTRQEGPKIILEITSPHASILIGKKGKNLDALQLLANIRLGRITDEEASWRVVLDSEGYRRRREESLVRVALKAAKEASKSRSSRLLEPMNPFERRLVHTALNERDDVITKSEGDGLYKRVRIIYKGTR